MKHLILFESFDQTEIYYHGTAKAFSNFKVGSEIVTPIYGGGGIVDQDLGIFFTDNLTMAKWFAGRTEYDVDNEGYIDKPGPGRVISAKLDIKNPWVLNDQIENVDEDDPAQDYFDAIKDAGGGSAFRKKLIDEGYDGVIVNDATTNYYEGTSGYSIVVVFDPSQIKIISKNVLID